MCAFLAADNDECESLLRGGSDASKHQEMVSASAPVSRAGSQSSLDSNTDSQMSTGLGVTQGSDNAVTPTKKSSR